MSRRLLFAVAASIGAALPLGAQSAAPPAPRVERDVTPHARGGNHLPVDLPLLAGASPLAEPWHAGLAGRAPAGLGELRLLDPVTQRELPYLLVWPSARPPAWRDGDVTPIAPGRDTSGLELDLGAIARVDRLEVLRAPERFLKRVRLEGSGDRTRWTMLVAEGSLFNVPPDAGGAPLVQTQLAFAPTSVRYLRLIWDDRAGGRLPQTLGARARLAPAGAAPADTLRAPLVVERRPSGRRTSRYHLTLPATRLPIAFLELDVGGEQLLRPARVTEPRLVSGRLAPVAVGDAMLRRTAAGDVVAANLRIPLSAPEGAELDLAIDDGDNPPLELRGVTAVFAPLPWIYFESPDGRALVARFGADRRTSVPPPRYDLEVMRDSVSRVDLPRATWGPARALAATAAARGAAGPLYAAPGAAVDPASFRYSRRIPPGEGLTAVRLDSAVLAHSRIDDVRILDAQGRQVPYVLEVLDEPAEVALGIPEPVPARDNLDRGAVPDAASRSWYRLRLPFAGLPDATLRIGTTARVFSRDIAIVTRELPRAEHVAHGMDRVVSAAWSHEDPDALVPPLEIALGRRVDADSLFLLVNDGDNQRLPLTAATLLLPSYRLRFLRGAGDDLRLVYGRADLAAPRYDIALLAERVLDAPATVITAGPEGGESGSSGVAPSVVFWAMLGVAVVVLLVLLGRLLKGT